MREILFRGQTRKYGERVKMNGEKLPGKWVYGGILQGAGDFSVIYGYDSMDEHTIGDLEKHIVHTDTIGQYTGLTDKNGVRIFEGDILKYTNEDGELHYLTVVFEDCAFLIDDDGIVDADLLTSYVCLGLEVAGNVHDDPQLLKGV